ncbi:uncharacterized protein LOC125088428 isoform X1 [Lutra lutra]|uniref:uncharacterized protein LOC125088428 isoform X1 n=2 Tax=Lutra lutra TaxID=9657 RepID=UPI001FD36B43|nr:uncharacterized protein LOC125088428 isoform X1 [Lutra lutra]
MSPRGWRRGCFSPHSHHSRRCGGVAFPTGAAGSIVAARPHPSGVVCDPRVGGRKAVAMVACVRQIPPRVKWEIFIPRVRLRADQRLRAGELGYYTDTARPWCAGRWALRSWLDHPSSLTPHRVCLCVSLSSWLGRAILLFPIGTMAPLYHILALCVGFFTTASAEAPQEHDPFTYDYRPCGSEGLIHRRDPFHPGILIVLSRRCRCKFNQQQRTGEPDEEEGTFRSSIRRLSTRRR